MKIKLKSIIALLLALAMALSLAACGNKDDGGKTPGGDKTETETPEYVYAAEYKELGTSERNMNVQAYTDDGFYATVYEKVGQDIPEGATVEYEGQYDIYQNRLYFVSFDGKQTLVEGYEPIESAKNEDENIKDFNSSSDLSRLLINSDGNLVVVENVYSSYYNGPDGVEQWSDQYYQYYKWEQVYYLRVLDANGNELSRAQIEVPEGSYLNAYSSILDSEGNLLTSDDTSIRAFAPDGTEAYTVECGDYVDTFASLRDGRAAVTIWGENGMQLKLIDLESKSLGEAVQLPRNVYNLVSGSGDYDLYYIDGLNFYGYNMETQQEELLLNWIDCDVNSNNIGAITVSEDGRITGISNTWDDNYENVTTELVTLTKVPYDSVPHKETLTMGVIYLDYRIQNKIIDFNRKNDKYRIEVLDYSQYNTDDDYQAGLTKLTTEIMAGNVPDILALSQLPYDQLASKGLLEDLYPYIEADGEYTKEDFFPNVMAALEVDGKLYQVCPSFSIQAVTGASSVVGDTPGWTYEEFNAALASMPEGCDAFDVYTIKDTILQAGVSMDMDKYVDWTTGQCSFDSQDFIELLKFTDNFPETFDYETYDWSSEDDTYTRISSGKQMLLGSYIYDFTDIMYYDAYFGGASTYIGYPNLSGEPGNMLSLDRGYAMSASCANKDAAWEFLRIILSEEYQKGIYGLPTNINVYQEKLKEAMTPEYEKDAEGNYVLDEDGNKIEISQGGYGFANGEVIEIYAVTQEQADKLWDLITTTTKVMDGNSSILEIVYEQAKAYYAGQKSAEEVAKLIQSKANIYVNEQR